MNPPPDYLDPVWDDAGDPGSWKYYVSDMDMVTWLDKPDAERERLAQVAAAECARVNA